MFKGTELEAQCKRCRQSEQKEMEVLTTQTSSVQPNCVQMRGSGPSPGQAKGKSTPKPRSTEVLCMAMDPSQP